MIDHDTVGSALDVGGTRARIYAIAGWKVTDSAQAWLPERQPDEPSPAWGARRVSAIAELVKGWTGPLLGSYLPTACAGRKDDAKHSVVLSFYGSPLPDLVPVVLQRTGVQLGPLMDDDVCAGWGHLASPMGGLSSQSSDTVLLTAGTGLAECLWVQGRFLTKGSYPRLAELGVEDHLRTEAWRDGSLPLKALEKLLQARAPLGDFRRVVLSGRFAGVSGWPDRLGSGAELEIRPLEEAPALGALVLKGQG